MLLLTTTLPNSSCGVQSYTETLCSTHKFDGVGGNDGVGVLVLGAYTVGVLVLEAYTVEVLVLGVYPVEVLVLVVYTVTTKLQNQKNYQYTYTTYIVVQCLKHRQQQFVSFIHNDIQWEDCNLQFL